MIVFLSVYYAIFVSFIGVNEGVIDPSLCYHSQRKCHSVDIHPESNIDTSFVIEFQNQNPDADARTKEFIAFFTYTPSTSNAASCAYPRVRVTNSHSGLYDGEAIIYDNDDNQIGGSCEVNQARCYSAPTNYEDEDEEEEQRIYDQTCLKDQPLDTDRIASGETYKISIHEDLRINHECSDHFYNAFLTLFCQKYVPITPSTYDSLSKMDGIAIKTMSNEYLCESTLSLTEPYGVELKTVFDDSCLWIVKGADDEVSTEGRVFKHKKNGLLLKVASDDETLEISSGWDDKAKWEKYGCLDFLGECRVKSKAFPDKCIHNDGKISITSTISCYLSSYWIFEQNPGSAAHIGIVESDTYSMNNTSSYDNNVPWMVFIVLVFVILILFLINHWLLRKVNQLKYISGSDRK